MPVNFTLRLLLQRGLPEKSITNVSEPDDCGSPLVSQFVISISKRLTVTVSYNFMTASNVSRTRAFVTL